MDTKLKTSTRVQKMVPFVLFGLLLFFRFPFIISVVYLKTALDLNNMFFTYLDCTYILSAILIWWQKERLINFHIDFEALCLFIFIPILKPFIAIALNTYSPYKNLQFSWIQFVAAIALGLSLFITKGSYVRMKFKPFIFWLIISITVGLLAGAGAGYLNGLQSVRSSMKASFPILLRLFFIQLSNAAIAEEPLFRGFIWGYLRRVNIKEKWIWLIQAGLFWIGHIYYFGNAPYSFFIIIPVSGLVFGFMAWRSRSIGSSMIVHGLANSIGDMVANL